MAAITQKIIVETAEETKGCECCPGCKCCSDCKCEKCTCGSEKK